MRTQGCSTGGHPFRCNDQFTYFSLIVFPICICITFKSMYYCLIGHHHGWEEGHLAAQEGIQYSDYDIDEIMYMRDNGESLQPEGAPN